jgi:hypothetical protein
MRNTLVIGLFCKSLTIAVPAMAQEVLAPTPVGFRPILSS